MTDLIRRADALEAVDVAMLGAYRPTFERVVKALRALPSVPTPDVSPVPPTAQKIHETKDEKMHRKVTCGCMCHDFGGGPFHPNQHCRCRGGEGFDDLSAPPVAPSEPSIYSHDENALPDNELPGMWEHADYEGGQLTAWSPENLEMARLFHDVYEEEAARLGWQSQTPVPFDELPEANKQTMLHTVARVRSRIAKTVYSELIEQINELESSASPAPSVGELEWRERFMAFDVGCIECCEPSSILGLFATEAEAQAKCDEWDAKGWRGGQHDYEVFDLQRILSGAAEEGQ